MNPRSGKQLFERYAAPGMPYVNQEFLRRNLLSAVLADLSGLFAEKVTTSYPVTEPTMVARLFALSKIQRTGMGISGFNPLDAINPQQASVEAAAAPHHDTYTDSNGSEYRTRIIKLSPPHENAMSEVEVFGVNFYRPDVDMNFDTEESPKPTGLVVVSQGRVQEQGQPITGETVLFAVRNKRTSDAKLYQVSIVTGDVSPDIAAAIIYESETSARLRLPDNSVANVELISGELLNQAVEELHQAVDVLKGKNAPEDILGQDEMSAIRLSMTPRVDS